MEPEEIDGFRSSESISLSTEKWKWWWQDPVPTEKEVMENEEIIKADREAVGIAWTQLGQTEPQVWQLLRLYYPNEVQLRVIRVNTSASKLFNAKTDAVSSSSPLMPQAWELTHQVAQLMEDQSSQVAESTKRLAASVWTSTKKLRDEDDAATTTTAPQREKSEG